MSTAYYVMDFVGGPFDGFEFSLQREPEDEYLFIPVAGTTDLRLNSAALARGDRPTSLAIYELCHSHQGWTYRFVCSESPTSILQSKVQRGKDGD